MHSVSTSQCIQDDYKLHCLCPSVFQRDGAVEDQMICCAVFIDGEIADALELEVVERFGFGEVFFHVAHRADFQRVGVHHFLHGL